MTHTLHLAGCTVDMLRGRVERPEGSTVLTTRELAVLRYLAARPDRDIPRAELHREVFEYSDLSTSRVADTTVGRLRRKLEIDSTRPDHVITIHGVGYRFTGASWVSREPPEPEGPRSNIREAVTAFVGRERDLAALSRDLERGARLVTLTGPPGIGKTRLAARYGSLHTEALPGGCRMVELDQARTLADVIATVAGALGIPLRDAPERALVEHVGHAIAARGQMLLVLDNFEQIADLAPDTVGHWLNAAPHASFLVTSRERLGLVGEVVVPLEPLPIEDAVALFEERARLPAERLSEEDRPTVEEICNRLDRIPLAIELAAGRMGLLTLPQMHDRLTERFRLLGSRRQDVPTRQASLRQAIDWSWQLLEPWEQEALIQCTVFAGGFSLEAAEAVLDLSHPDAPWIVDVLDGLYARSLLRATSIPGFPGEVRLGLYESIREFARDQPRCADTWARLTRRHATHYLAAGAALAEREDQPGGVEAIDRLSVELQNLLAIHRRFLTTEPRLAAQAVLCVRPVLSSRGPFGRIHDLTDQALRALDTTHEPGPTDDERDERRLRVRLLCIRARTRLQRNPQGAWEEDFETALRMATEDGDPHLVAGVHARWGGRLLVVAGRMEEGEAHSRTALAAFRTLGDRAAQCMILLDLAVATKPQGRLDETMALYDEALRLSEEISNLRVEGITLGNLAILRLEQGDLDAAAALFERSLAISRESGSRQSEGIGLCNLGMTHLYRGDPDRAEALLTEALGVFRLVANRRYTAIVQSHLGWVQSERGDFDAGLAQMKSALDTLEQVGNLLDRAALVSDMGFTRWQQGSADEAAAGFRRSADMLQAAGADPWVSLQLAFLGAALALAGDVEGATKAMTQAKETRDGVRDLLRQRTLTLLECVVDVVAGRCTPAHGRALLMRFAAEGGLYAESKRGAQMLRAALATVESPAS